MDEQLAAVEQVGLEGRKEAYSIEAYGAMFRAKGDDDDCGMAPSFIWSWNDREPTGREVVQSGRISLSKALEVKTV